MENGGKDEMVEAKRGRIFEPHHNRWCHIE